MKKAIKLTLITATLGAMFGLGTYAGANTDWKTEVVSEANARIGAAAHNKKEEILNYNIDEKIIEALDPKIKEYEEEIATMLEDYYQLKLQGLTDGSAEIEVIEVQMEAKKQFMFETYSKQIDAMFGG